MGKATLAEQFDVIVREQHGLVTTGQAERLLGPNRKARWIAQGRLFAVQPAVFRVSGAPDTWHQSVKAAQLASDGIVSHRSAAELWGLIQPCGYVEVSVKPEHRPRLQPPAIAHRIIDLRADLASQREGMALTDPVRTVIDLGLVMSKWEVGEALSRGITTKLFGVDDVRRLREALGRPGRNGTGVVRRILEERSLSMGTEESMLEKRFGDLCRKWDLPMPLFQYEVWHGGRFIARVDAAYPESKLAIEVDGFAAHTSPDAFQRDRTRQNRLIALGWTVLRFTWDDVVKRPQMVAREITEALQRLSAA